MAEVRANWMKLVVGTAKRRPEPLRTRLLEGIGEERRAEIRKQSALAWLPVSFLADLSRDLTRTAGDEGAQELWRASMVESIQRPLLTPLYAGAVRIFGRKPRSLYRFTPQAWSLVTRGVATASYEPCDPPDGSPGEGARITFSDLHETVRGDVLAPLFVGGVTSPPDLLELPARRRRADDGGDPTRVVVEAWWSEADQRKTPGA